jgi:outer membrane protein assembly factor BamE (lipoprotein component of BamABCDE complex)
MTLKKLALIAIFSGIGVYLIWVLGKSELPFYPYPYIDTEFSPGASLEKMKQVESGMTEFQVRSLLGEPFSRENYGPANPDCWQYTGDGAALPFDFSWYSHQVCFKEGKVSSMPVYEFND